MKKTRGDYAIVMDCDLQHDPIYIKDLISKAQEGFDIVFCRNVLLHMTTSGAKKALASLKDGVKIGGLLIPGDTDPNILEDNWERKKHNNVIFWKKKW